MEFLFELRTLMKKKVLRIKFYIESPINRTSSGSDKMSDLEGILV